MLGDTEDVAGDSTKVYEKPLARGIYYKTRYTYFTNFTSFKNSKVFSIRSFTISVWLANRDPVSWAPKDQDRGPTSPGTNVVRLSA
jgi:hypothetical protein